MYSHIKLARDDQLFYFYIIEIKISYETFKRIYARKFKSRK